MGDDHGNGICLCVGFIIGVAGTLAVQWCMVHFQYIP
jgi:hypothetical protein